MRFKGREVRAVEDRTNQVQRYCTREGPWADHRKYAQEHHSYIPQLNKIVKILLQKKKDKKTL